ncbi:DUF1572 family protein [Peribacillus tepidiphilus]|uniref:DUF1572 family protein n=1 Tax=Peribacillus tepidiphilus TaxID=2652445 RepID=UPI001291EBCF|nr:DUF1572 family protein [Peribacillus tepidiphilus]
MSIGKEYIKVVNERFTYMKKTVEDAIVQVNDEDLFWSANGDSNSIAVIMKHMSGNMISRWTDFFKTDGEKENRNRDREFINDFSDRSDVLAYWEKGWNVFLSVLGDIEEQDLLKTVTIRQEEHTVLQAIERQMYHYSYHVGQIVYIAKQLKSEGWKSLTIPRKK